MVTSVQSLESIEYSNSIFCRVTSTTGIMCSEGRLLVLVCTWLTPRSFFTALYIILHWECKNTVAFPVIVSNVLFNLLFAKVTKCFSQCEQWLLRIQPESDLGSTIMTSTRGNSSKREGTFCFPKLFSSLERKSSKHCWQSRSVVLQIFVELLQPNSFVQSRETFFFQLISQVTMKRTCYQAFSVLTKTGWKT